MAGYEKQTWTDKITDVTAERMNHIEKGIEDAGKTGGVETGSVIGWTGAEVPEGYEEVDSGLLPSNSGVEVGTIVYIEDDVEIPEGWEEVNLPKKVIEKDNVSAVAISDGYSYEITATQLGVDDCSKYIWFIDSGSYRNTVFNCVSSTKTQITFRSWKASGLASATLTLQQNATDLTDLKVKGVRKTEDTKPIKKVAVTELDPITGSIVDGTNIDDKATNTYSANQIDKFNTYSTEEVIVGYYVKSDGTKVPRYRKTIETTFSNSSGGKGVEIDLSSLNIDVFFGADGTIGYGDTSSGGVHTLGSYLSASYYSGVQYGLGNSKISVWASSSYNNGTVRMTIEYTKTTD